MGLFAQIAWGSVALGVCALVHIAILVAGIPLLQAINRSVGERAPTLRWFVVLAAAFAVVVLGHTAQTWIWAVSFVAKGAFTSIEEAVYFALVTSTTLGYGDITLGVGDRMFAAMSAVSGLLTFGLSTAFLIRTLEGVRGAR